jgi:hypothetical protein
MAKNTQKGVTARRSKHELTVLDLSAQGWSLRRIGAHLGISHVEAMRRLHAVMDHIRRENLDRAAIIRDRQLADIEMMREKLLPVLDERVSILETLREGRDTVEMPLAEWQKCEKVTATMMKLFEREAALVGADAPKKVEQTNSYKATDDELAASVQMVSPILQSLMPKLDAFRASQGAEKAIEAESA